jgi:hypothetical protein
VVEEPNDVLVDASHEGATDDDHMLTLNEEMVKTSVADPDPNPDPHVFGPPGSGSFYH